jgi:hypothetical protein
LRRLLAVLFAVVLGGSVPAGSQPSGAAVLRLELSLLEAQENACRHYVTMENRTEIDFATLRFDVFLFDGAQAIVSRVAVASRRIRPNQTRVLVFDVPAVRCDRIGRVLVNEVLICQEQGGRMRDDCDDLLRTASRIRVPLVH